MVHLYGAELLERATGSEVVRGLNNAPGGEGGVDTDVQNRLGADGAPAMVDRRHGICCGISATWIIGLVNGRTDAQDTGEFGNYFEEVLRFQGAYFKDEHTSIDEDLDLLAQTFVHECEQHSHNATMAANTLATSHPDLDRWAAYLSIWGHAIGIGKADSKYYIMDPNAGLYEYGSKTEFDQDVLQLIEARRTRKGRGADATIKAWFYKKA